MTGAELSYVTGKDASAISRAKKKGSIIRPFNLVVSDSLPTVKDKKALHEQLKLENETWHIIKGSDDQFKVSNYGRFKRVYKIGEKFLLPVLRKQCGNMVVKVKFKGVYKSYRVKDIVAAHFLRKPQPNEVLRHANGIKTDDFAGNLQWIDRKKPGEITGAKSKGKPVVKVDESGEVLEEYRSAREAARKEPYSRQTITDYCNRVTENSYGDVFMWLEDYEKEYGEILD